MQLVFKRIFAWMIDWTIILLYAGAVFGVTMALSSFGVVSIGAIHPVKGQIIGFFSLTVPIVLYCILLEAGTRHATLGKRIMKIEVTAEQLTVREIVIRNILKFIPWEVAHAGVLWVNYINTPQTPLWIWLLLIIPQVLVIAYFISVIATKGSRSLYDMVVGTSVRHI